MKIKTSLLLCLLALAAVVLLGAPMAAIAVHPDVTLFSAPGVTANSTTPYSPKESCATAACHDYGSGVINATHTQGVIEANDQVYWQSYNVKSFAHGVSIGRHANQGRNEDYSTEMRTVFGDPFFTSSPGMFGKY